MMINQHPAPAAKARTVDQLGEPWLANEVKFLIILI
jgi:hypothetical protein